MNLATSASRGMAAAGERSRVDASTPRQLVRVVGAALGMGGGFAALYFGTLSVFLKPIANEFAWGRAQTAAAAAAAMVGVALGALVVGRAIDRLGARLVIGASAFAMALLIAVLSRIPNSPAALAGLSFAVGLVGVGTTPAGYLSVLARYFDRRLGLALGTAMVGLGLGSIAMPVLAQGLIDAWGWRDAYAGLAGLSLALAVVSMGLLFGARPGAGAASPSTEPAASLVGDSFREVLRSRRFLGLALIVFAVSAAGLGAGMHVASLLTDRGLSSASAAQLVSLSGAGVALGRLLAGALLDRFHAPRLAALGFLLGATGLAMLAGETQASFATLAVGTFLTGFVIGAEGDFIPFVVRRYFGLRAFGASFGCLFGIYALGGVAGPVVFGVAFDSLGGYRAVYGAAAAVCLACAAAVLLLGPYRFAVAARPGD